MSLIKFGCGFLFFALSINAAQAATPLTVPDILDASALKDGSDGKPAINPCENFYQFSCGRWLENIQIPADKAAVSHQNTAVMDKNDEMLRDTLLKLEKGDAKLQTQASAQLLDFYNTCMNFAKTKTEALKELNSYLSEISAVKQKSELAKLSAHLQLMGTNAFFNFSSGQDPLSSNDVIGFFDQGTIGLPEPSYYFQNDKKSEDIRKKYIAHITKILNLAQLHKLSGTLEAKTIFEIEKKLASKAYSFDDRQDPGKTNHPITLEGMKQLSSEFDWSTFLQELQTPKTKLNVNEPEFFAQMNEVIKSTPLEDLKVYLKWQLLHRSAASLAPDFQAENFEFWNKALRGEKKMKPRWKICTIDAEHELGYALAEVYVKTIDTVSIRAKISDMISWIKQTFSDELNRIEKKSGSAGDSWLDPKTKEAALAKLNLLKQKVGAPDQWRDYSTLKTDRSSFFLNDVKVSIFESRRDLNKMGKPVDRTEWDMMPWEFNAYYDPPKNEFVFPFGILQPPSFDIHASDGANLGAFGGGTIGHELTHGYDNNGRQYDANGNLKDWWSAETKKNFEDKSQCYVKQANQYKIEEVNLNVDGKKTLPENLADQGGVKLGYMALLLAQTKRPPAPLWLGKYTENQQYWIAYAQSWCEKKTPENLRVQITTNEHPPEEFRTNGVIMNRPEFAHDFGCKPGDKMAPVDRCSLW